MSAVRVSPQATYLEPLLGWRFWRVERIQTLSNGSRFRLCAAGYRGVPKVWQPRVATAASCSDDSSRHDAPHPKHECGVYAYRERLEAERHLVRFVDWDRYDPDVEGTKPKKPKKPTYDTWAFGRVLLWGRVVECKLGWRAQFAYPYELTVFQNSTGRAAATLAGDYAVDVQSEAPAKLTALLKSHSEIAAEAREARASNSWHTTSIYGIMNRSFLKPYHKEILARLDEIERKLDRHADKEASDDV